MGEEAPHRSCFLPEQSGKFQKDEESHGSATERPGEQPRAPPPKTETDPGNDGQGKAGPP